MRCRFSPIGEEESGQLDSEDAGGAGVKAAEPTDWHSDGNSSDDDDGDDGTTGNGPTASANGSSALAGSSSRGRVRV